MVSVTVKMRERCWYGAEQYFPLLPILHTTSKLKVGSHVDNHMDTVNKDMQILKTHKNKETNLYCTRASEFSIVYYSSSFPEFPDKIFTQLTREFLEIEFGMFCSQARALRGRKTEPDQQSDCLIASFSPTLSSVYCGGESQIPRSKSALLLCAIKSKPTYSNFYLYNLLLVAQLSYIWMLLVLDLIVKKKHKALALADGLLIALHLHMSLIWKTNTGVKTVLCPPGKHPKM
ncbi:hypothetical protein JRQ81_010915, partial [Phrynocephalus forsythii]